MKFPGESFRSWQQILEIPTFVNSCRSRQQRNCMRLWVGESASVHQWGRCALHKTDDTFAGPRSLRSETTGTTAGEK